MDVTADFLTGAILSWALPLGLLVAITIWWLVVLRRRSQRRRLVSVVRRSTTDGLPPRTIFSTSHMRASSCPGTRHAKR